MCSVHSAPIVHTARLRLRPLRPEDASPIAQGMADDGVLRMLSRAPRPYALQDAAGFIAAQAAADPATERVFAITERDEDEAVIGCLGFHPQPDGLPELGYWLSRSRWGRGLMTEAVRAALGWTRDGWGRRAVTSGHFADNGASGRVLTKAGFLYTGVVQPRFSKGRGEVVPTRMMIWLA